MRRFTEEIANEIYDILVECGGARESNRDNFVWVHVKDDFPTDQYRFQGHFGFGGKFYSDGSSSRAWRVSYHPDDVRQNLELYKSLCSAINILLHQLWERHADADQDS